MIPGWWRCTVQKHQLNFAGFTREFKFHVGARYMSGDPQGTSMAERAPDSVFAFGVAELNKAVV